MQLALILISLALALAAPAPAPPTPTKVLQGERVQGNEEGEMVIRLVLHVRRSNDGTQLVVDLTKSEESSAVVRPAPKPIVSLSTELPFWRSSTQPSDNTPKIAEKSYDVEWRSQQRGPIKDLNRKNESHHDTLKLSTVVSSPQKFFHQPRPQYSTYSSGPEINSYNRNGSPDNTSHTKEVTSSNFGGPSREDLQNEHKLSPVGIIKQDEMKIQPKLEFKISVGRPTTPVDPIPTQRFDSTKIYFPPLSSTAEKNDGGYQHTANLRDPPLPSSKNSQATITNDNSKRIPERQSNKSSSFTITNQREKPISQFTSPTSVSNEKVFVRNSSSQHAYEGPMVYIPDMIYTSERKPASSEESQIHDQIGENGRPYTGNNKTSQLLATSDGSTNTSYIQPAAVELYDKAVADQGFGVLASRCEGIAPGLVSDGAGGCTKPIARPKNKNYQSTYTYRSAAENELHSNIKDTLDDELTEESDNSRVPVAFRD